MDARGARIREGDEGREGGREGARVRETVGLRLGGEREEGDAVTRVSLRVARSRLRHAERKAKRLRRISSRLRERKALERPCRDRAVAISARRGIAIPLHCCSGTGTAARTAAGSLGRIRCRINVDCSMLSTR